MPVPVLQWWLVPARQSLVPVPQQRRSSEASWPGNGNGAMGWSSLPWGLAAGGAALGLSDSGARDGVVAAAALDPFESELQAAQVSAIATAAAKPERTRMLRDLRSNCVPNGV